MVTRFVKASDTMEKGGRVHELDTSFLHGNSAKEKMYKMFPINGDSFEEDALEELCSTAYYDAHLTDIPAGMTYLGQFIAHDVTNMNISSTNPEITQTPIDEIDQLATPTLDLDGLYGEVGGFGCHIKPEKSRFHSQFKRDFQGRKVIFDIPRDSNNPDDSYLIGDVRNDENLITSQLHVLFLNLHNRLMDIHENEFNRSEEVALTYARKEATLLYQHVIVNDFLRCILEKKVYKNLFHTVGFKRLLNNTTTNGPRIPFEFVGAAFRFGHSIVRPEYFVNFSSRLVTLEDLFQMTGKGKGWADIKLNNHIVEWPRFFDMRHYGLGQSFQRTLAIDPNLDKGLHEMKNEEIDNQDLRRRNQHRGRQLKLPSGQAVVEYLRGKEELREYTDAMGLARIYPSRINQNHVFNGRSFVNMVARCGFDEKMPLWTYLLTEPHFLPDDQKHKRLGVLGSIIVGEVFRDLLEGSRASIYRDGISPEDSAFLHYMKDKSGWENKSFDKVKMADLAYFTYY